MELLLRAKHWQVFVAISIVGLFSKLIGFYLMVFYNSELPTLITYVLCNSILIGWYVLVGIQLKRKIDSKLPHLFVLFVCSAILIIIIFFSMPILSYADIELSIMLKNSFILIPYLIISFFLVLNLAIFPAKALRIVEIGDDIDINDYFGDIFRILFLPIGIWNIQPRLNKIAEMNNENVVSSLK